ncbi:MAG: SGNH/GDSL hydrolase family protein [Melioribacteraceae bacterium]|nr:MAG: SGNH/GDSL hydrolase family protein [Melioribacteraceae bacterium]
MKIFLFVTIMLSCIFQQSETAGDETINYLALGDSYTIGESVLESDRFPVQLTNELNKLTYNVGPPLIIAKTGWTTDELSAALDEKETIGKFDFVTLLIGVNNQYRGRDAEEFRKEFIQLLNRAAGYTHSIKNVIIVSIPDWGVTPFAVDKGRDSQKVGEEIDIYNSIKKQEAEDAGAHYVYITDISKEAKDDESLLAHDKLHPSGKMYSLWVERILPIAKQILDIK